MYLVLNASLWLTTVMAKSVSCVYIYTYSEMFLCDMLCVLGERIRLFGTEISTDTQCRKCQVER